MKVFLWPQEVQDSKYHISTTALVINGTQLTFTSGFKFLPILGKYIADCFENKASKELREKWRLPPSPGGSKAYDMAGDGSRAGPPLRKLSDFEKSKL